MMARMRTINEAIAAIKEQDPHTALTPTALRRMIRRGELPCITIGIKYLVNLDVLISHSLVFLKCFHYNTKKEKKNMEYRQQKFVFQNIVTLCGTIADINRTQPLFVTAIKIAYMKNRRPFSSAIDYICLSILKANIT